MAKTETTTNTYYFEDDCYYLSQNKEKSRIPIHRGKLNICIEKWTDGNGNYLDVSYTDFDLPYMVRKTLFEKYKFHGNYIVSMTLSPKDFDSINPCKEDHK